MTDATAAKAPANGAVASSLDCAAGGDFDVLETVWIVLPDGCRLAARLWLPKQAAVQPVATIFEFIPYRLRDVMRARDTGMYGYFASCGYACLRVDMRGSGDSDGLLGPMYSVQERRDGVEVMRWIAAQPWSSGRVGMLGLSWGGSIALYCAAEAPPELGAIICIAGPHDSYARDIVYKGGCLINEVLGWGATMDALNARPPDPEIVGEAWRDMWRARLEGMAPEIAAYLAHQHRDAFWDERTVSNLAAITCPALIVGGWADSTVGTGAPDLVAQLGGPRRGLMGPWAHKYPQYGVPGPAIDFLPYARRWFDRHLNGNEAAADEEPALRAWMLEDVPAKAFYGEAPGRWVGEAEWPSPRIKTARYFLNSQGLEVQQNSEVAMSWTSIQTVGAAGGELMPGFAYAEGDELPGDQQVDDAGSLAFTSAPINASLEILGSPTVQLSFCIDKPLAFVVIRLCDVSADGVSRRVSYAVQNLTHLNGDRAPEKLTPGRRYDTEIRLHDIAYSFRPGHRLRVSISTTYWPLCWPSPEVVTLTLFAGASSIDLPVRPLRAEDTALPAFDEPQKAPAPARTILKPPARSRTTKRNEVEKETELTISDDNGCFRVDDTGMEVASKTRETYMIRDDQPLSACVRIEWDWRFRRADWSVAIKASSCVFCSADSFHLAVSVDTSDGEGTFLSRTWALTLPRDHI